MYLAKNFGFGESASIAFDRSSAKGLSPNPYYKQKERTNRLVAEMSSLFYAICSLSERDITSFHSVSICLAMLGAI